MFFIRGEKGSVAKNHLGLSGHSFFWPFLSRQDKVVAIYSALDEDYVQWGELVLHAHFNEVWSGQQDWPHVYLGLAKGHPWVEHLPKRGVDSLSSVSGFNHKRAPMYAYSNSLHTNWLKCWTNNNIQQSRRPWKLMFWWHTTPWMAKHYHEHGVASKCCPISQLWRKATVQ